MIKVEGREVRKAGDPREREPPKCVTVNQSSLEGREEDPSLFYLNFL